MAVSIFYVCALGFISGVFSRSLLVFGLPEIIWLLMVSLVLALLWRRSQSSSDFLLFISLFVLFVAAGALRLEWATWSETNSRFEAMVGQPVELIGVVVREPDIRERTTHLYTNVEDEIILVIVDRYIEYEYGDLISIRGELSRPESFTTDLGRTFNYPGYLLARGVSYLVLFGEAGVESSGEGHRFLLHLYSFKQTFMDKIERLIPEPQVGLGEGLLLGVKRALGDELEEVFRRTGIIHIVVLSGYNIMLVVAFVMSILAFCLGRRLSVPLGLLAIFSFALLVGLSATVVRASIMAALLLIASATGRIYLVLRALLLAGVTMLVLNPYLLVFDTGFQLSFLATLGLIVIAPYLTKGLKFFPNFFGSQNFLVATLATQIAVLPLLLYQIGEFSAVSVVVNVLVLPMVPVAMLLTFLTGLVALISPDLAMLLGFVADLSLQYIIVIATWFSELPYASMLVPAFPFPLVGLSYLVMGLVFFYLNREQSDYSELSDWTIQDEADFLRDYESKKETPTFFR